MSTLSFQLRVSNKIDCIFPLRCHLPEDIYPNDTWEVQSDYHQQLISQYIPSSPDYKYDRCNLFHFVGAGMPGGGALESNATQYPCTKWVYSDEVFKKSFTSQVHVWNLWYKILIKAANVINFCLRHFSPLRLICQTTSVYGFTTSILLNLKARTIISVKQPRHTADFFGATEVHYFACAKLLRCKPSAKTTALLGLTTPFELLRYTTFKLLLWNL